MKIYKPSKAAVKAAGRRLNRESRGTDLEYQWHLMAVIEKNRAARERALRCLRG